MTATDFDEPMNDLEAEQDQDARAARAVVTNYSDLTMAMRSGLIEVRRTGTHPAAHTRRALHDRGYLKSDAWGWYFPATDVRFHRSHLTPAGRKAADALMAADETREVPPAVVKMRPHRHDAECGNPASALGYLEASVRIFLRGDSDRDELARDLAQVEACYQARLNRPAPAVGSDVRTCAFPGDQEHDHHMCEDAVIDTAGS